MNVLFNNSPTHRTLRVLLFAGLALMTGGCAGNRSNLPWDKQLIGTWHFKHPNMSGTYTYNADGTNVMRLSSTNFDFKGRWVIVDREKRIIENHMNIAAGKPSRILVTIKENTMTQQAVDGDIVYTYTRQ